MVLLLFHTWWFTATISLKSSLVFRLLLHWACERRDDILSRPPCMTGLSQGPFNNYVTLFLYFLTPLPLCHRLSHFWLLPPKITSHSFNPLPTKHETVWIRIRFLSQSILLHWTYFPHQLLVSPRWWQVVRCADYQKSGSSWCIVSELLNTRSK